MSRKKDKNVLIYGIGYYSQELENSRLQDIPGYPTWRRMLQRCYDNKLHDRSPSYKDCAVCEEWHSLFYYNEWYLSNYYNVGNQQMELDKDILVKGNKIYSPDTCVFVPRKINHLIIGANKNRGKYPIGVYYDKTKKKYVAHMSCENRDIKLQQCNSPVEAFFVYKFYKEAYIKQVAEEYKEKIPEKLYQALIDWEVEITD